VFDLPERPLMVTEHQASIYRCAHCRGVTKAAFPEGVVSPAQYGERLKAAAIYLNIQQLIPEDRTAQALSDLIGAPLICPASIVAWVGKKAQELQQVYQRIGERVAEAKVRCLDETGFRIAGSLQWLHTTSSLAFTFYRAGEKRGAIPQGLQGGVVVHDHFLPYRRLEAVDHAFCNAHVLRELQSLIEFDHEPWAELMRDMLLSANLAVNKARQAGALALPAHERAPLVERYWAAVRLGLAFHRQLPTIETPSQPRGRPKHRPGHNLLQRLKTFQTETLRFLTDFDVPFTNNLAEQDLRMMKVKMKISGAFRTLEGAQIFATLRSVVSTARKQGCNVLQTLAAPPNHIIMAIAA
jgi:transposase